MYQFNLLSAEQPTPQAEREAKETERREALDSEISRLKSQYRGRDPKKATGNLKEDLQQAWPGVNWSVRKTSGIHADVRWEDGPTKEEAMKVINRYQEFRGTNMDDSIRRDESIEGMAWKRVCGSIMYVGAYRSLSSATMNGLQGIKELYPDETYREPRVKSPYDSYVTWQGAINHGVIDQVSIPQGMSGANVRQGTWEMKRGAHGFEISVQWPERKASRSAAEEIGLGAMARRNEDLNGLEVVFPTRPDERSLSILRRSAFRYSRRQNLWWAKDTPTNRETIKDLGFEL